MTDPILMSAKPLAGMPAVPSLADLVAAQPLAAGITAFLLLYALLTVLLRLADRIDPPPVRTGPVRRVEPPPRVWRFRKAA